MTGVLELDDLSLISIRVALARVDLRERLAPPADDLAPDRWAANARIHSASHAIYMALGSLAVAADIRLVRRVEGRRTLPTESLVRRAFLKFYDLLLCAVHNVSVGVTASYRREAADPALIAPYRIGGARDGDATRVRAGISTRVESFVRVPPTGLFFIRAVRRVSAISAVSGI